MTQQDFSPFAWAIATQKNYVHKTEKTWGEVSKRVSTEVFRSVGDVAPALPLHVEELINHRQFMPGGRYLYATGRPFHQTQNCWSGETGVVTKQGLKPIKDLADTTQTVLTSGGSWTEAEFKSYGFQDLLEVNLQYGRATKKLFATAGHRWFTGKRKEGGTFFDREEKTTAELKPSDALIQVYGHGVSRSEPSPIGIIHGLIYGDGCKSTGRHDSTIRLCGEKDKQLLRFFSLPFKKTVHESGDTIISGLPCHFKDAPELSWDRAYLFGWLAGYFAADGCASKEGLCTITSYHKESIDFVKDVCYVIGVGCNQVRYGKRVSNLTNREHDYWSVSFDNSTLCEEFFLIESHKERFLSNPSKKKTNWVVTSVNKTDRFEEVYCAEVPGTHSFVIEENILSGNCLLLRAQDSREGWSDLLHKASMALMTGAGIGVDYSSVREEGAIIRRTGGLATGPIALMQMLNECGRGIMQGGSRRCLMRGAPVTMADGSRKPVEAVRVGDEVLTRFGARQVVGTAFQGVQEVFRVKTKHGEVLSSGNHRWLGAKKDRTTQWVQTKKLKPGWALYLMGSPVKGGEPVDPVKDEILSIESVGSYETFDLQIDEVEEFVAYDHVSHNSAIWAGLNWRHPDAQKFIAAKNWSADVKKLKEKNFSFPATLDQTNISILLDDRFFEAYSNHDDNDHALANQVYWAVVRQMLETAEPGFSIDVGANKGETLRNACCEVTSRDSNDICNLGSLNMGRFNTIEEFGAAVWSATAFLLAGTLYSDVPYPEVDMVRTKNRRLGLGLMGVHEWLLRRGKTYGPDDELAKWMGVYAECSRRAADVLADKWRLSRPAKVRAIAPTGTISIVAETSSGIEPIFCVAYKRRYLRDGKNWVYQYVIDPVAKRLIEEGADPNKIEDAYSLASDIERRVVFQSWLQGYVDHGISSTINLPHWGSEYNNEDTVQDFGNMLMKYLPTLRGVTVYPDGARGGQPLTPVPYVEAVGQEGIEIIESAADICSLTGKGTCGD